MSLLSGGHLTFEDAWAWSRSAHTIAGSDSIDFRSRHSSEEERSFLTSYVTGSGLETTYMNLENAGQVLLVVLEPEDECGAIFLRLYRATCKSSLKIVTVAPFTSTGSCKMKARLLRTVLGSKPGVVDVIAAGGTYVDVVEALLDSIILVGKHTAQTFGLPSSVVTLAEHAGVRLARVPRRAGGHAAIEAGLFPDLLPFGRGPDEAGTQSLGWDEFSGHGLDAEQVIEAVASDEPQASVVGGVDIRSFDEPAAVRKTLEKVSFLAPLEVRASEIIDHANIVLPAAPAVEKNGIHINWKGCLRPLGQVRSATFLMDHDVLIRLTEEFDLGLDITTLADLYEEANPPTE